MGFSTSYENDFELIPQGEYEVTIKDFKEKTTKSGKTGLNFKLKIRSDVEQECKGKIIWHTFWKRKNPTQEDLQVAGYSFKQMMFISKIAKIPNGKNYGTVFELCRDLIGKMLRVSVIHEEYGGYTNAVVDGFSSSKFALRQTAPPVSQIGNIEDFEVLSDGDVPF